MFITAQASTPGLALFWQLHQLTPSSCFLLFLFLISLAPAFIVTPLGGTQATCYLGRRQRMSLPLYQLPGGSILGPTGVTKPGSPL